jgi:hypothetical protein
MLTMCYLLFLLQKLKVHHVLDVMHCEKNVCENILKYLVGEKDNPHVKTDTDRTTWRKGGSDLTYT